MSLLDTIIDNHGADIVSENHDAGNINWVNGLTDPGEMIGCGMYQQLRRHAGEADVAYQSRITVELEALPTDVRTRIATAMRTAALKRAGLDTSNGRVNVMVAGELPWHGLGVNVAEAVTSAEAIKLAGLDWTVLKQRLYFEDGTGTKREAPDVFGVVRQDTHEMLGSVGNFYKPIQNTDGFDFLDSVLEQFGAKYETAGSIYGGKQVWMLARLPRQSFTINGDDDVEAFAMFTNPHDGTGAAFAFPTSVRTVCANTFRTASHGRGKGISIRHTGNVRDKITVAQEVLGVAVQSFEQFRDQAEQLYAKPLEIEAYASDVLDAVLEITQAQADMGADVLATAVAKTEAQQRLLAKTFERKIERRAAVLEDILDRYESERCGVGSIRGTAWAAFNAVTEHADHNTLAKPGTRKRSEAEAASRKFESVISGEADEMKQVAFEIAMRA